jgi:predicted AAA+ superfamily ATPase
MDFGETLHSDDDITRMQACIPHVSSLRACKLCSTASRRWLDLLVGTFQWFEVPAFSGNAIKRTSGKAKGYLSDSGLACWAQAITTPTALGGHPLWGHLFESFIAAELRKQMAPLSPAPRLHHWRSTAGAEVDLLLEANGRFFPIEVKAKTKVSRADTRGITAFRAAYPNLDVAPGLVIAPCERMERISENDYSLPWNLGAGARTREG